MLKDSPNVAEPRREVQDHFAKTVVVPVPAINSCKQNASLAGRRSARARTLGEQDPAAERE